jgi:hypothetical protein
MKVTACGKEAWKVNHEPMNKNLIEGFAMQTKKTRLTHD